MDSTYAIIIGVSEYAYSDVEPLPAAAVDAVVFGRALINWGIPESHFFLFSGKVTRDESIGRVLEQLSHIEEPFQLIFYFCGHGYRTSGASPKSSLLFSDSTPVSNHCNLEELLAQLSVLNTTNTFIFIDACHLRLNLVFNPRLTEEIKGVLESNKSLFCLLSSGILPSYEDVEGNYGYFTRSLMRALSNKRDSTPSELVQAVQKDLAMQDCPIPEAYAIGAPNGSLFPPLHPRVENSMLVRPHVIADIQDHLVDANLWVRGDYRPLLPHLVSEQRRTHVTPPQPEETRGGRKRKSLAF